MGSEVTVHLDNGNEDWLGEKDKTAARIARRFVADQIADPVQAFADFKSKVVETILSGRADAIKARGVFQEYLEAFKKEDFEAAKRLGPEVRKWSWEVQRFKILFTGESSWYAGGARIARPLFWSLLQQYALPPAIQRGVDMANRFWSKSRMSIRLKNKLHTDEAKIEYIDAFFKLCLEMEKQADLVEAALAKGRLHSEGAGETGETATKIKAGSFTLVNAGNFPPKTMAQAVDLVTKAEAAMKGVGLGKVCYGDIQVTKTIRSKGTIAAFYLPAHDEMFVRANTPPEWDTVRIVCHELTHRLQNKFLQGKQADIDHIYQKIKSVSWKRPTYPVELYPHPGDTVVDATYGEMQVIVPDFEKSTIKMLATKTPGVTYTMTMPGWLKAKGLTWAPPEDHLSWVTKYASTDPDENFAEMVSFYAIGKLPKAQIELLEPLLV